MFADMGLLTAQETGELEQASESWVARLLATGEYIGWLAECDGKIVAGAGALMREQGPAPGFPRVGKWVHIVNVYTERPYRRQGIARELMTTILDWCQANAIMHVTLGASADGRALYESLGFRQTSDMKLAGSARI